MGEGRLQCKSGDASAIVRPTYRGYAGKEGTGRYPMTSGLPFDDFRNLMRILPAADRTAARRTRALFQQSGRQLGRLEEIAVWLSSWSGVSPPSAARPLVAIFAGNHGVVAQGISPRPMEATAEQVDLCASGGAAVSQLCQGFGLGLKVFDLALDLPTEDITQDAALDEVGCAATMAFGMEAVAGGTDLLCIGDLGVGNSTVAAAILCMLYGGRGVDWVGPGSGADEVMLARKAAVVDAALAQHGGASRDSFEILRRVGGREFAAIAGAILAARAQKIPVLLDGFAATAAAAVLHAQDRHAIDHCMLAQRSAEPGHAQAVERLRLDPVLDLGVGDGEGTSAALAAQVVKAAALAAGGFAGQAALQ